MMSIKFCLHQTPTSLFAFGTDLSFKICPYLLQGVPMGRRPGLSCSWFLSSTFWPSCPATSAKLPSAREMFGWEGKNQNPINLTRVYEHTARLVVRRTKSVELIYFRKHATASVFMYGWSYSDKLEVNGEEFDTTHIYHGKVSGDPTGYWWGNVHKFVRHSLFRNVFRGRQS